METTTIPIAAATGLRTAQDALFSALDAIAPPTPTDIEEYVSQEAVPVLDDEDNPEGLRLQQGDVVVAIVASGGDEDTNTPAFGVGTQFRVVHHHDNGWIQVAEGFLWPTWVELQMLSADEDEQDSSEEDDDLQQEILSLRGRGKTAHLMNDGWSRRSSFYMAIDGLPTGRILNVTLSKLHGSFGLQVC